MSNLSKQNVLWLLLSLVVMAGFLLSACDVIGASEHVSDATYSPSEDLFWESANRLGYKQDSGFVAAHTAVVGVLMDDYKEKTRVLEYYGVSPDVQFPHCISVNYAFNTIGWVLYAESPNEAGGALPEAIYALAELGEETERVRFGGIGQIDPLESGRRCAEIWDGLSWPDES